MAGILQPSHRTASYSCHNHAERFRAHNDTLPARARINQTSRVTRLRRASGQIFGRAIGRQDQVRLINARQRIEHLWHRGGALTGSMGCSTRHRLWPRSFRQENFTVRRRHARNLANVRRLSGQCNCAALIRHPSCGDVGRRQFASGRLRRSRPVHARPQRVVEVSSTSA